MANIVLNDLTSSFGSQALLNENFTTIETALNNDVLYKTGTEANAMQRSLDMDNNDIINTGRIDTGSLHINGALVSTSPLAVANIVKPFPTLAGATSNTDLIAGDAVDLAERTTGNGGGGMWEAVLSSAVTENTFNIVQCIGVPTLSLVLREETPINMKKFGAIGDGSTNDSPAIESARDQGFLSLFFPESIYNMDTEVLMPSHSVMTGVGGYNKSVLRASGNNNVIRVQTDGPASATFGHVFAGLTFASLGTTSVGVVGAQNLGNLAYNVDTVFYQCYFDLSLGKGYSGDALQNRWVQTVVGKFGTANMTRGIEIIGETAAECNANSIHQCHISTINGDGVYIQNGSGNAISGMTVIEVCQGYLVNCQGFLNVSLNMYGERAEQAAGMIRFAANAGGINAGAVAIESCQLQVFFDGGGANKNLRVFDEGGNVTVSIEQTGFGTLATGSYALGNNRTKFKLSSDSFFPGGFSDHTIPDITINNSVDYKRINESFDAALSGSTTYLKTITHDNATLESGATILRLLTQKAASSAFNFAQYRVDKDGTETTVYNVAGNGNVTSSGTMAVSGTLATVNSGTGSPEGVVAAPVGSMFMRTDGGTGTAHYVKETGAATSAGWVAK